MKGNRLKTNKSLYQVIGITLLFVTLAFLFINTTLSWFRDESITSNGKPNIKVIGTIGLDVSTNFNIYNLTFAPDSIYVVDNLNQNIATTIKTNDKHNIDGCFVRIKFENVYKDLKESDGTTPRDLSVLSLYFIKTPLYTPDVNYQQSNNNEWVYDDESGYYYYLGIVDNNLVTFNDGYRINNRLDNSVKGEDVILTFTVEAIQRQYGAYTALWDDAPKIFNTYASTVSDTKRT